MLASIQLLHKTTAGIHEEVLLQPMAQHSPLFEKDNSAYSLGKAPSTVTSTWPKSRSQSSGTDFFCSEGLLIDCQSKHLVDAYNYTSHKAHVASAGVNKYISGLHRVTISSTSQSKYANVLNEFMSLTQPQFSTSDDKHDMEHYIVISDPPTCQKAWGSSLPNWR